MTEVAALRDAVKARGGNVLTLMAGDAFQGSLFFTTYSGAAEAEMLNRVGLDAMVYGNHEFDLGPAPLAKFVAAAKFPVLSGSVDVSGDKDLAPLAVDHLILDIGGQKVAILGATTPDTPEISSPGPTVSFRDPVPYLTEAVAAVTALGANKVILLSHLGTPLDEKVAAGVPGIDAIVGGHTHDLFSNTDPAAPFRYPVMVTGPGGVAVPIVQAGAYSKYLGHETLVFDDAGNLTSATGDTVLLDASVKPDEPTLARIKELAGPITALKEKNVAEIKGDIDATRELCRSAECPMGDLVTDAMLARVKGQGVTIALTNGGGLRASIRGGTVTMGDVIAVLPFQNTLSTFNIKGADLVAALENGLSQVEEGAGRFPQVAGLRLRWDATVAPGQGRVKSVEVRDGTGWVPLQPEKVYSVASNNFLRAGGDGYVALRDGATNAYDFGPGLDDVLADFLAATPDYAPETGRITREH
ncbi:bifunctional metallophosphatase/5'-nucleotidase [Amaricoccus sp.]|uniref:bifunctional metallophosphatase/5'-nucleotidase n=1 Tax=Amaricoccus sp. TaxID=1872485 RepID=UPI0039E37B50